jgi:hypothetical protein
MLQETKAEEELLMAKALMLAWASPASDETDGEFNTWYESTHIPQLRAAIGSICAVHRYRTAQLPPQAGQQQPAHSYLAVYELDSDDVPAALAALGTAMGEGRLDTTAAMDVATNPPVLQWYHAAG